MQPVESIPIELLGFGDKWKKSIGGKNMIWKLIVSKKWKVNIGIWRVVYIE